MYKKKTMMIVRKDSIMNKKEIVNSIKNNKKLEEIIKIQKIHKQEFRCLTTLVVI